MKLAFITALVLAAFSLGAGASLIAALIATGEAKFILPAALNLGAALGAGSIALYIYRAGSGGERNA